MLLPPDKKDDQPQVPLHDPQGHLTSAPPSSASVFSDSVNDAESSMGASSSTPAGASYHDHTAGHTINSYGQRNDSYPTAVPPNEQSALLPPAYSPPTAQQYNHGGPPTALGKPRSGNVCRKFLGAFVLAVFLLFLASILGLILFVVWAVIVKVLGGDISGLPEWKIGGADGEGKWDTAWDVISPLDPKTGETYPRSCDLFSEPVPIADTYPARQSVHSLFYLDLSKLLTSDKSMLDGQLFFNAHGNNLAGSVSIIDQDNVVEGARELEQWEALIKIEAMFTDVRKLDGWHACKVGKQGGRDVGVVLAGPVTTIPIDWPGEHLAFQITIQLPKTIYKNPVLLDRFLVSTRNMNIEVGNPSPNVIFNSFSLFTTNAAVQLHEVNGTTVQVSTTNGALRLDSVKAAQEMILTSTNGIIGCGDCCAVEVENRPKVITVQTSNDQITGSFCAREVVSLRTTSGQISAKVNAPKIASHTTNAKVTGKYSGIAGGFSGGLDIRTTNGQIDVEVDVPSPEKKVKSLAGRLSYTAALVETVDIKIATTNSKLQTTFTNLPIDSALNAVITTTNAALVLQSHPHYQGDFSFATSGFNKVDVTKVGPLAGETDRDITFLASGKGKTQGSVARKGESKDDATVWGNIVGRTSNQDIQAYV